MIHGEKYCACQFIKHLASNGQRSNWRVSNCSRKSAWEIRAFQWNATTLSIRCNCYCHIASTSFMSPFYIFKAHQHQNKCGETVHRSLLPSHCQMLIVNVTWVWYSHGSDCDEYGLLGCKAVQFNESSTFRHRPHHAVLRVKQDLKIKAMCWFQLHGMTRKYMCTVSI
jgi:hypothetical protein